MHNTTNKMPLITKKYKFCAAHRYWNPEWDEDKNFSVFREDVKLHGHNYELDITIGGPVNQDSGFIINIIDLNSIMEKFVISNLDHSQIDKDIDYFKERLPSTENLVIFIWSLLSPYFENQSSQLHKIFLRETPTIYTEYYGPENNS